MIIRQGDLASVILHGGESCVIKSGTVWEGAGDNAIVPNYQDVIPESTTWQDQTALEILLDQGGSVDLEGGFFRVSNVYKLSNKSSLPDVTHISNGTLSGGQEISDSSWTESSGVYTASAPALTGSELTFYLEDLTNPVRPVAAQWPRYDTPGYSNNLQSYEVEYAAKFRFSASPHWIEALNTEYGKDDGSDVITSIQINDAIETAIQITSVNCTDYFVGCLGGANQIDWSPITAYDDETKTITVNIDVGSTGDDPILYAFFGSPNLLAADNEYAYSPGSQQIHYKKSTAPSRVSIPVQSNFFTFANGVTFDRVTFLSNRYSDTGLVSSSAPSIEQDRTTFTRCKFYNTSTIGHNLILTLDQVQCYDSIERGFNTAGSSIPASITNSRFVNTEEKSWLFLNGTTGNIGRTVVNGNFFQTHGAHAQALACFQNSPKNLEIKNNIFFNCRGSIALHGGQSFVGDDSAGPAQDTSIENNLFVTNKSLAPEGYDGQPQVVLYTHVDNNLDWQMIMRYNTLTGDLPGRAVCSMQLNNDLDTTSLGGQEFYYEGNIAKGSLISLPSGNGGAFYVSNASCTEGRSNANPWYKFAPSFGSTDLVPGSYLSETFQATGDAVTAAPDSGQIGIRWANIPAESDFATLRLNFKDMAQPDDISALPLQTTGGPVSFPVL